jgi:hypothetical protein
MLIQFINVPPSKVKYIRGRIKDQPLSAAEKIVIMEDQKATDLNGDPVGFVLLTTDSTTSVSDSESVCNILAETLPGYTLRMPANSLQVSVLGKAE